ncbi:MAG: ubiquinol-cytochrome c reductase iron-sulfur subunit [Actinomycetota bacterium]|nr:ubiquinol-cytochrome c reductase iron-sulfur subunit [Actinomycetota bacterium]
MSSQVQGPGAASGDGHVAPAQEAGQIESRFPDPGLPEHHYRQTDIDERAAKRAERQVASLFLLSLLGSIGFVIAYFALPVGEGATWQWAASNMLLGGTLAISIFCIGAAAIHWAKKLMPDEELVEERHPIGSTPEEQAGAVAVLAEGAEGSGFGRRKMIWGSMVAAMGAMLAPALVLLRDLGPLPGRRPAITAWSKGDYLVRDPENTRIKAADVPIGGVVHVLPEGVAEQEGALNEKAKSAVLVIRLEPDEYDPRPARRGWDHEGIVAYSKICTHVGCPVGLYEQNTHHLLCPCHQSTFDVLQHCAVIFGPAARALPQLALTVDDDGYLIAEQGFTEPVGPSYWERD